MTDEVDFRKISIKEREPTPLQDKTIKRFFEQKQIKKKKITWQDMTWLD